MVKGVATLKSRIFSSDIHTYILIFQLMMSMINSRNIELNSLYF